MKQSVAVSAAETSVEPVELQQLDGFPGSLRNGQAADQAYQPTPLADAQPLDDAAAQALLDRLEALPVDADDTQDFALRPGSQPPPRTGATVQGEFPPVAERVRPAQPEPDGPFQVLRYSPEGEVGIAGQISVSFDRPMIAVTSHADTVANGVPVTLSPAVPGQWRWVGTRTLLFQPEAARLPMATAYTVSLLPDARAADGSAPAEPISWTFATPAPVLQRQQPSGQGIALQPLIVLGFDQRIDASTLLPKVKLRSGTTALPALRLATDAEIEAAGGADQLRAGLAADRVLLLTPQQPLPTETRVEVVVEQGAPSAEGPCTTSTE
ncbi:MAG: Ig-like domain-containing protein, partial [Xanthomonadales bacterium]|nr:Ig-like domain-containing protein [Xanthomonadales bacterium]